MYAEGHVSKSNPKTPDLRGPSTNFLEVFFNCRQQFSFILDPMKFGKKRNNGHFVHIGGL